MKNILKKTRWSDHRLSLPVIFNLYHGLEVLMKGFIHANGVPLRNAHKLSALLCSYQNCYPYSELGRLFSKYIKAECMPEVISNFFAQSGTTVDAYYQALKYPESKKGEIYEYRALMYHGVEGAKFYRELSSDIETIRKKTVSLGRRLSQNA